MSTYPVAYVADMPERRSRASVFFRAILFIPVYVLQIVWGIVALFTAIFAWFALVFTGRYPEGLYATNTGLLRFFARANAYMLLQTDAYPPLGTGEHPEYPVRVLVGPPKPEYSRVKALFRIILAIPVYIINYALTIVGFLVAIVMWFAALIVGRSPEGLHNALNLSLSYYTKSMAYMYFELVEDWPPFSDDQTAIPAGASTAAIGDAPPPPPPAPESVQAGMPAPPPPAPSEGTPPPPPPPPGG